MNEGQPFPDKYTPGRRDGAILYTEVEAAQKEETNTDLHCQRGKVKRRECIDLQHHFLY